MRLFIQVLLCLVLFSAVAAFAELPKQVEQDFAVLRGTVIMPLNGEYIVNLDDRDQLHVGDILTLVTSGETIYHPVTKEVIGSVDVPVGFLQVTRISSGYSYAKLLSAGVTVNNGASVRRFEQVPALFVDDKHDDGSLARQVRTDLPQFRWLADDATEKPLITFMLQPDALVVKSDGDYTLHKYAVKDARELEAPPAPEQRPFVNAARPESTLLDQVATGILTTLRLEDENSFAGKDIGIIRHDSASQKGIWLGPKISGSPTGIAVADLDGDGIQETALALQNRLLIAQINQGEYTEKAEVDVPARLQILSMDAIDLDKDGIPELCLTAVDGFQLASFVVKFNGTEYVTAIDNIRWFLRAVDMPDGERILVGQGTSNDEQDFRGKPHRFQLVGNRIEKGEEIDLPGLANMFSFVPFADKDNQLNYAYLTKDDHLRVVSAAGVELWESEKYFGGSESCFYNRKEHWGVDVMPTCVRSRLIKTKDNEILVAQNDSSRVMERFRTFKESRLVSLSWNGFAMMENWRTVSQKGYLADFALGDANNDGSQELVMAVLFKHKGIVDEARSTIVTYEMN